MIVTLKVWMMKVTMTKVWIMMVRTKVRMTVKIKKVMLRVRM